MVAEINGPSGSAINALDQRGTKISQASEPSEAPDTKTQASGAEVVTLTDLAARLQQLTQSVADLPVADRQKIESLRQSIADGSYVVEPNLVAEKLVALESLLSDLSSSE